MTLIERLIRLHEGVQLRPYRCPSGRLTIGVGRNLEREPTGITLDEALYLLANDLRRTIDELQATYPWVNCLDAVRYAVLVDMHFNLGANTFGQFTRTLALVEAGDYAGAAGAMLQSKWAQQVGARARRLAGMMATGSVPPEVAV